MQLLSVDIWWEGQVIFSKIYWMITIPASLIFLIQLGISIFKNNESKPILLNTPDTTETIEPAITFHLITFRNFIGFFTAFGWSGFACIDSDLSNELTLIISIVCGVVMMLTMAIVFYVMGKLMKSVREELD
jgi:hypothetical protein